MYKLIATIIKDLLILTRDRLGLIFMFAMPIILALVITATQNSTFELVNNNKVPLLVCNKDTGIQSKQMIESLNHSGMFTLTAVTPRSTETELASQLNTKDALAAVLIPSNFSKETKINANLSAGLALKNLGLDSDSSITLRKQPHNIILLCHPVLQQSFRQSIQGALQSSIQLVQTKEVLQEIFLTINEAPMPDSLESSFFSKESGITEKAVTRDGNRVLPNASQHNIPAWTIFAMFFVVISLGSSLVREKTSGSFVRLRTLPTRFFTAIISKMITYLMVTFLQAFVIFAIGIWIFPHIGLPALNIPNDIAGLILVTLLCGLCAVSFAVCIGIYAQTQEQANGIGAVSIVLLAAIGGLLVPSFAMPASFQGVMKISPLHWCLEAYYGLFLEDGSLKDIIPNIIPLLAITVGLLCIAFYGLKRKKLI